MGYLIAIEGIDGAGKTTLARLLAEKLSGLGFEAVVSHEPTRGPHGEKIRALAASGREGVTAEDEINLFTADRREHVRNLIEPALGAGKIVILDRYFYSTMAYQGARGADPWAIEQTNRAFAPVPDLLLILKLDVPTALERIQVSRGETPNHFEKAEALEAVDRIFDKIADRVGGRTEKPTVVSLDARQSAGALLNEALGELSPHLTGLARKSDPGE